MNKSIKNPLSTYIEKNPENWDGVFYESLSRREPEDARAMINVLKKWLDA